MGTEGAQPEKKEKKAAPDDGVYVSIYKAFEFIVELHRAADEMESAIVGEGPTAFRPDERWPTLIKRLRKEAEHIAERLDKQETTWVAEEEQTARAEAELGIGDLETYIQENNVKRA